MKKLLPEVMYARQSVLYIGLYALPATGIFSTPVVAIYSLVEKLVSC